MQFHWEQLQLKGLVWKQASTLFLQLYIYYYLYNIATYFDSVSKIMFKKKLRLKGKKILFNYDSNNGYIAPQCL